MYGKLIVLEGIDGSGKSTIAKEITEWYKNRNIPVERLDSIIDTNLVGHEIRKLINANNFANLNIETQTLLMIACINEAYYSTILPLLQNGTTVVVDRLFYSTWVYQNESLLVSDLCAFMEDTVSPDLVFWINTPVNIAKERLLSSRAKLDELETVEDTILLRRQSLYKELSTLPGIVEVNGSNSIKEIMKFIDIRLSLLHGLP